MITAILIILIAILGLPDDRRWDLEFLPFMESKETDKNSTEILRDGDWNGLWRLCHVGHCTGLTPIVCPTRGGLGHPRMNSAVAVEWDH